VATVRKHYFYYKSASCLVWIGKLFKIVNAQIKIRLFFFRYPEYTQLFEAQTWSTKTKSFSFILWSCHGPIIPATHPIWITGTIRKFRKANVMILKIRLQYAPTVSEILFITVVYPNSPITLSAELLNT
jgi:hypothetical protein